MKPVFAQGRSIARSIATRFLSPVLLLTLVPLIAFAQLDRGTVTGLVSDGSGAAIPAAQVTVVNLANNAVYKAESSGEGQFNVPNLPVGLYELTVESQGFKKFVRRGVEVRATEVVRVDAALQLGSMVETIEVTAEISRLQTDSPQVGTSLGSSSITNLPLSFDAGRSPEAFAYKLTPGVVGTPWASHVNGSTTASKEVLLDGASVSTNRAGHFGEASVSLEAVEEFKVQTSGMSAEFGRMQAGVFNFIMRSGTNRLRGSAFGALRNEALNANTFANNARGERRPQDRKQNFGGSFGGPVYIPKIYDGHDKTFFYTAYERYRERSYGFTAPNTTMPLPEFYEGDFSRLLGPALPATDALGRQVYRGAIYDPATMRPVGTRWVGEAFPGNVIPRSRFSEVSKKLNAIAKEHYVPSVKDASGQYALQNNSVMPSSGAPEFDQHQFSIKGDHFLAGSHKLSGSYTRVVRPRLLLNGGMWEREDPVGGPLAKTRRQTIKSQLGRFAYDWTMSPTLLLNVNASVNRMGQDNASANIDLDGATMLGLKNLTSQGMPEVSWGGGPFVSLADIGNTANSYTAAVGTGLLATASYTRGKHFLKFGFDHRRNQYNNRPGTSSSFTFAARGTAIPNETFSGSQTGYAFASYLLGIVDSAGMNVPLGTGGRRHYYSLFLQDDFKVRSDLTLNLGVRWEFAPPYFEVAGRVASWNIEKRDPETGLLGAYDFAGDCNVCTGKKYFGRKVYDNFAPRLGFAWQASSKWTIRGAYGIFFEGDLNNAYSATPGGATFPWQGTYLLSADPVTPWRGIFNWDAGFPTDRYVAPVYDVSRANKTSSASYIDPGYGDAAYTQQWNLNLQRQLGGGFVLDVGYVGNKSTGLKNESLKRLNQLPASVLTQYRGALTNPVRSAEEAAANSVRYPFAGYRGTVAGALREFPQLLGTGTFTSYGAPLGFSTYHSLQVTLDKRFSKGFSVYGNYVWSKVMSNTASSFMGENAGPLDYYNLSLEKAPAPFDQPHALKAYVQYDLPFGHGRALGSSLPKVVDAVVGGWALSCIVNYASGAPLEFSGASSPMPNGWNGGQRINAAAGEMKASSFAKANFNLADTASAANTYLNKGLFSDPEPFTLGNAAVRYSQIRGFGTMNEDFGLLKNFRVTESARLQIRGEILNAFNRHQLGNPNTNVKNALFGQITGVSGARNVQIGARLDF
jgi:hypothetical protein